jgi:hypothetical protein
VSPTSLSSGTSRAWPPTPHTRSKQSPGVWTGRTYPGS